MSSKNRDNGVFKVIVGVQLPVFLVHRELIQVSAIASEVRPNDGSSVPLRQLCGIYVDADTPRGPFHPHVFCIFRDIPQEFILVQVPGKRPGLFRHLVSANIPPLSPRIRLEILLYVQC